MNVKSLGRRLSLSHITTQPVLPDPFPGKYPTRILARVGSKRFWGKPNKILCRRILRAAEGVRFGGVDLIEFDRSSSFLRSYTLTNSNGIVENNWYLLSIYYPQMASSECGLRMVLNRGLTDKYRKWFPFQGRKICCYSRLSRWSESRKAQYLAKLEGLRRELGEEVTF